MNQVMHKPCLTAIYTQLRIRNAMTAIRAAASVPFAAWPSDAVHHEAAVGDAMRRKARSEGRQNETRDQRRAKIIDTLDATPGLVFSDIRDATGISDSNLGNDLKALRLAGKITSDNKKWRLTTQPEPRPEPKISCRVKRRAQRLEIIADMLKGRQMTINQVAVRFGVTRHSARDWLNELEKQGRVVRVDLPPQFAKPMCAFTASS
jgi:predicted Rossmann fold nucleotide-binding protein DprA/Smf involved in DNA uptake